MAKNNISEQLKKKKNTKNYNDNADEDDVAKTKKKNIYVWNKNKMLLKMLS